MEDHQSGSFQPNGFLIEDRLFPPLPSSSPSPSSSSLSSSSLSNVEPLSISDDCWQRAEKTTQEIICQIQPSLVSEQRRKAVIDYIQRLIRNSLGSEVFPFGSVPLKTYLPDGDIDLTAICLQNVEDSLANDVHAVLKGEEQNESAEFEVKDVQYIQAEVKLVKCLVQNIVVDISFNQLGGLSTLCFLEKVDHLIGKNHLFKRSVILIKAWCYYESRILGAHHGLISTYALETLVLYIFHLFHSSLDGPLAVLYKFLDYFCKFDWDHYCISLNGPVHVSSLPEILAETPINGGGELLLSQGFLRSCVDMFSVPSRGLENNSRAFLQKYFNIVDPLKENNNLGRSVSKGNFYRIRSAFTYGARKLSRILVLPVESVADELNKFFVNTLYRDGRGERPDVRDYVPILGACGSGPASSISGSEKCRDDKIVLCSPSVDSSSTVGESRVDPRDLLCKGISDTMISSGSERKPDTGISNEPHSRITKLGSSLTVLKIDSVKNGNTASGYRLAGDAKDLASNSLAEKEKIENENSDRSKPTSSSVLEKNVCSRLPGPPDVLWNDPEETIYFLKNNERLATVGTTDGSSSIDCPLEDLCVSHREGDLVSTVGSPGPLNSQSDLSGDYDVYFYDLQSARRFHDFSLPGPIPSSPSQFRNMPGFNNFHHQSMQMQQRNIFSPRMNVNGVVPPGPQFYPSNPHVMAGGGSSYGAEEVPRPRGTGTYIPITNHRTPYRDRPVQGRGRNPSPVVHGRGHFWRPQNGWVVTPPEANLFEKANHEPLQAQPPVLPVRRKPGPLEFFPGGHPVAGGFPHANSFVLPPEKPEFGSRRHLPGTPLSEGVRLPVPTTPVTQGSTSCPPTPALQRPRPVAGTNPEGIAIQSYQLKDESDFPPLSI